MDPTEGSETLANINQTLEIHQKVETVNGDSIVCCWPDWLIARTTGCFALSPKHFTNQAKSLHQTLMVAQFLCGYVEEKSFLW
jgi:hypothetical protein